MSNVIQSIFGRLQGLLGQSEAQPVCKLGHHEIPTAQDLDSLPLYTPRINTKSVEVVSSRGITIACNIQIRPNLQFVNIRSGPRLDFDVLALTVGGTKFKLQGASEHDFDGYRWYAVSTPDGVGWVRGDMVLIGSDCLGYSFMTEDDVTPIEPNTPSPTDRFDAPAGGTLTQGYSSYHPGYDLGVPMNTPITAPARGYIIRLGTCPNCAARSKPNIYPCTSDIMNDPAWGYGYGNYITVRHHYAVMPQSMRDHMDANNLTDGFVYVLYAHLSTLQVRLGDGVVRGQQMGLSGNHGCSTAPHLHFEVRMGRDETVDGRWQRQTVVHPTLVFDV